MQYAYLDHFRADIKNDQIVYDIMRPILINNWITKGKEAALKWMSEVYHKNETVLVSATATTGNNLVPEASQAFFIQIIKDIDAKIRSIKS